MNHSRSSHLRLLCLLISIAMSALGALLPRKLANAGEPRNANVNIIRSSTFPCRRIRSSRPGPLRCCLIAESRWERGMARSI